VAQQVLCLLTIHGIGFEQAPDDAQGIPGYADGLHANLARALGPEVLSDDPGRIPGGHGAIYVQSLWPEQTSGQPTREQGLARLGQWAPDGTLDTTQAPLVTDHQSIAHVALVYSHLEPVQPHVGSGSVALEMAAVSWYRYATLPGLVQMLRRDLLPVPTKQSARSSRPAPSLRARTDAPQWHPGPHVPFTTLPLPSRFQDPTGAVAVLRNLENDVAVYVSRNDLRQRVRDFVREALLRLLARADVAGVVLNGHSNGTVIAFDVARELPGDGAQKVRWFVTAGSALRKYTTLFNWGTEVGTLRHVQGWTNFRDLKDPVADPLEPSREWRLGQPIPSTTGQSRLYYWVDPETNQLSWMPLQDIMVDNVANGGSGGLPAHDYWDNQQEFVEPVAEILKRCSASL